MNRQQWTEAMIAERIMACFSKTGLMPTNTYLQETGQGDLANQISKKGGFPEWAQRLGLPRTISDTHTGWDGEKTVAKILTEKGFRVMRSERVKWPYDLLVSDLLRIDVKSAKFASYDNGRATGWFYRIGKHPQADVIAFYQLDTGKTYFVPWFLVPHTNVTISSSGGKYRDFEDRFDLLTSMLETRVKEANALSQGKISLVTSPDDAEIFSPPLFETRRKTPGQRPLR